MLLRVATRRHANRLVDAVLAGPANWDVWGRWACASDWE